MPSQLASQGRHCLTARGREASAGLNAGLHVALPASTNPLTVPLGVQGSRRPCRLFSRHDCRPLLTTQTLGSLSAPARPQMHIRDNADSSTQGCLPRSPTIRRALKRLGCYKHSHAGSPRTQPYIHAVPALEGGRRALRMMGRSRYKHSHAGSFAAPAPATHCPAKGKQPRCGSLWAACLPGDQAGLQGTK